MPVHVEAPFPGTILQILVSVGDTVKEDEEILIIEAMKMENPIAAPSDGQVKEIKVKVRDEVKTGQVLIVLE
jgi:acetyl-CoA carboxylase biotin carboxyl carrier protein